MAEQIKVGFCVAYDWYFLAQSIPLIYESADRICLALDKDRISWAGQPFSFDEVGFHQLMRRLDPQDKIDLYEDDFHRPELQPMQNENRQRMLIAQRMGVGGWHVQLDADEYFLNFDAFSKWLRGFHSVRPVSIRCPYITLFKQLENSFLIVHQPDYFKLDGNPIATNQPDYQHGRVGPWFNIYAPYFILHQSWARTEPEIQEKVNNWGHKNDFDTKKYLRFWIDLHARNYEAVRNFNPLRPASWPQLKLVPGATIQELERYYRQQPPPQPSALRLAWQNSIWASRLRRVLGLQQ